MIDENASWLLHTRGTVSAMRQIMQLDSLLQETQPDFRHETSGNTCGT